MSNLTQYRTTDQNRIKAHLRGCREDIFSPELKYQIPYKPNVFPALKRQTDSSTCLAIHDP